MISKNGELSKITINIDNKKYNIEDNNLIGALKPIYKEIAIEKKLLNLIKKN